MSEKAPQKQVKVAFPENLRGGVYANNMLINQLNANLD